MNSPSASYLNLYSLSNQVVEGQHIELSWVSDNRWNLAEDDYLTMCIQKTAWYTCITPCRVGAIIGGASETEIDGLVELGKEIGIAFQIQDDVLNLIGDVGRLRKRKSLVILVRANAPSFSSTLSMPAPLPKHSMSLILWHVRVKKKPRGRGRECTPVNAEI